MGGEQRFALLRETLFDLAFGFLPQIAARFAGHGIGLPASGQLGDCARLVAPFIGGRQRRSVSATGEGVQNVVAGIQPRHDRHRFLRAVDGQNVIALAEVIEGDVE